MKLIIAGGRDFDNYRLVDLECSEFIYSEGKRLNLNDRNQFEIVSGGQRTKKDDGTYFGADYLGEKFAAQYNFACKVFPADWSKHGKRAGILRNFDMSQYASHLIAFWDGKSKGTKNMIDFATKKGLVVKVVRY